MHLISKGSHILILKKGSCPNFQVIFEKNPFYPSQNKLEETHRPGSQKEQEKLQFIPFIKLMSFLRTD